MTEVQETIKPLMRVPMLDLKEQYQRIKDDVRTAINRVIESQQFILGAEVDALEREVAAYSRCAYGVGISSGTDALLVALMALDTKAGDEIITTPYSFFATAGSIARLGARPVFVDIDPYTFNLDAAQIEAQITKRTRAIIPVHLYGQMSEMDEIMDVAGRYDLYVIEDAAQSIGAQYKGQCAGSIGDIGCYSFFPSKNLGAFGDGGMVTSNKLELAERMKLLRNHGMHPQYYHKTVGGNFRLDALQAAILRVKLKRLDEWIVARQNNAARYDKLFAEAGLINSAGGRKVTLALTDDQIVAPYEALHARHTFNYYVIRCRQRERLRAHLTKRGIGTEIYYPIPLHLQECFSELGHRAGDLPNAEAAAQETLALPIYPELSIEQQECVVHEIKSFYQSLR